MTSGTVIILVQSMDGKGVPLGSVIFWQCSITAQGDHYGHDVILLVT